MLAIDPIYQHSWPVGIFREWLRVRRLGPRVDLLWCLLILVCGQMAGMSAAPVAWKERAGYRYAALTPRLPGKEGFTRLPGLQTGIHFTNRLDSDRWLTNTMLLNGSGVAAGDVDGDGFCDLFFASLQGGNTLYRNLDGLHFEDISRRLGFAAGKWTTVGCALADIDGDRDLDLIFSTLGQGTHVLRNDGHGQFEEIQLLNLRAGGTSLSLADIDGDGDLDLYQANYRTWTFRDKPGSRVSLASVEGRPTVTHFDGRPATDADLIGRFKVEPGGALEESGDADLLALNDGTGRFAPVSFTDGRFLDEDGLALQAPPYDWGLSVLLRDLNGDGAPDIYVCNDFASPDRLWINDGRGRFRAVPRQAIRSSSRYSMGVDAGDLDRDGDDDLFLADMLSPIHSRRQVQVGNLQPTLHTPGDPARLQYSRNSLLLNRGDGTYADAASYAGVTATEWTWGVVFLDVDLDGYEDILTAAGNEMDSMDIDITQEQELRRAQQRLTAENVLGLRKLYPRLAVPKMILHNQGNLTFTNAAARWGFETPGVSHGICLADIDNDGDMDVILNSLNGEAEIYRNDTPAPRVAIRLRALGGISQGVGARLSLTGAKVAQSQVLVAGGRYLSSDQAQITFAAPLPGRESILNVRWPSGRETRVVGVEGNGLYEIDEHSGVLTNAQPKSLAAPLFESRSEWLGHRHQDDPFNDFERQPLLPHQLSRMGPGVCWADVDGDGWEDAVIGSGRGGHLGVFLNRAGKGFESLATFPYGRKLTRDQTSILSSGRTLFVGSSSYEDGGTNGGALRLYSFPAKSTGESVMGFNASAGPMAMVDLDKDGDLDLFIGGQCVAGRYPEPADASLLRNDGGRFHTAYRFERLGLVNAALFSDLDGDGSLELIVACEWGSLRVFSLSGFHPTEITDALGLGTFTGAWQGLAAGDFDNDGRMDLVGGNWGLNQPLNPFSGDGLQLYYGPISGGSGVDILEAYLDKSRGIIVPSRLYGSVGAALPFLRESFPSYTSYSTQSVERILGERIENVKRLHARRMETMVFLNRPGGFEAHPLPLEAQLAPVFGVTVADFDGDGNEDLFLAQNFFGVPSDGWRLDAGRGQILTGDGHGGFRAMSGQRSGIALYGEQRGSAAADFNHDGRVDLLVGVNSGHTELLINKGALPGFRLVLQGSAENPEAVGSRVRMRSGGRWGPAREIRAGSGHWSQDASTLVFARSVDTAELDILWPDGQRVRQSVGPELSEIWVRWSPAGAAGVGVQPQ